MIQKISIYGAFIALFTVQASANIIDYFFNRTQGSFQEGCAVPIERVKGGPDDYRDILANQTRKYQDNTFPTNSAIIWQDYQNTTYQNSNLTYQNASAEWFYVDEVFPDANMFGEVDEFQDVTQGNIDNSYFISGCLSVANTLGSIEKVFATKSINDVGIYAFNVYAMGIPTQITIDGQLPFSYMNSTMFADEGYDGAIWGPLLEKAWAKMNGNYEQITGGSLKEAVSFLKNAPASDYDLTYQWKSSIWGILDEAFSKGWGAGVTTQTPPENSINNMYDLTWGQSYALMGTYELKDTNGTVQHQLIKFRQPRSVVVYSGPWSRYSSFWTQDYMDQVNYDSSNDEVTFIDVGTFLNAFESLSVFHQTDNYTQSWYYDTQVPNNTYSLYYFNTTKSQDVFIDVLTWSEKTYPYGCTETSNITFVLFNQNGSITQNQTYTNNEPFKTLVMRDLQAGEYLVAVNPLWGSGASVHKEINIRVTASEAVNVTDWQNNTNQVVWSAHDDSEQAQYGPDNPNTPIYPIAPINSLIPNQFNTSTNITDSFDTFTKQNVNKYIRFATDDVSYGYVIEYLDDTYQNIGYWFGNNVGNYTYTIFVYAYPPAGSTMTLDSSNYLTCDQESFQTFEAFSCTCIINPSNEYCGFALSVPDYQGEITLYQYTTL